jgi:hypothetical protein
MAASVAKKRVGARAPTGKLGTLVWPKKFDLEQEVPRMNSVIYLIGLVVVVLAILSFLGLS